MGLFLPTYNLFETIISSQQAVRNSLSTQQDFEYNGTFSRDEFKLNNELHCYSHERFKKLFLKNPRWQKKQYMTKVSVSVYFLLCARLTSHWPYHWLLRLIDKFRLQLSFSKWLSPNSLNSMNSDKAQNQNGYREYPTSGNSYILRWSSKNDFLLLCLDMYLFSVVSGYRYLPRGSKENVLSITITRNVTMSRKAVLVVTILFLDFVMIHWIHWIQWHSFRKKR